MTCDPFTYLDGAYSIGALDADDLAAYQAHLRTCAECRTRVEELRQTVQLLAAARSASDPIACAVPDTLLPGLLRRAGRERARQRWVTRCVAGLAAACLVALLVVVLPLSSGPQPAPQGLVALAGASPVEATARVVAEPWGTKIDIHCNYKGSMIPGAKYALRVIDRDHRSYALGTWSPVPDRAVSFTAGTAVRRERIARVQVTLADGTPILQLTL